MTDLDAAAAAYAGAGQANSGIDPGWWRHYPPEDLPRPHAAALEQFVRFGYHGTSIRRIASAAEMTVPGLYYHFKSKDQILATLLLAAQEDIVARARAALDEAGQDARQRFIVQVENSTLHTMYRQEAAFLAREIRYLEDSTRTVIVDLRDELEEMFYAEIQRGMDSGQFSVSNARSVGRAILALCRSIAGWYQPGGSSTPEEVTAEYVGLALLLVGDRGSVRL